MPEPATAPATCRTWLACLGFFLVAFGVRLLWVDQYANATPYWDQWDAEAASPLKSWLEGHLTLSEMFAAHDEHRLFTFRVLAIALLELNNRIWNPLLEMAVNAGLYAGTMALFAGYGMRLCRRERLPLFLVGTLLVTCIPFDYDDILGGFNSQYYFLILFSLLFLWLLARTEPLRPAWWGGLLAGVLATFSMASGVLAPLAGAGLYLLQWLRGLGRDRASLISAVAFLAATAVVVKTTLGASSLAIEVQHPQSLGELFYSLNLVATWPFLPLIPVLCLLLNLPWFLFAAGLLRQPPPRRDPAWFLLACGGWVLLQFGALAYARGATPLLSRYKNVIVMGPLVNLLCLAALPALAGWQGWLRQRLLVVWPVLMALGLVVGSLGLAGGMEARHRDALVQETRLRAYLVEGQPLRIDDLAYFARPYPSASMLKGYLDDPTIHAFLPPNILPANGPREVWWARLWLAHLAASGWLLVVVGSAALLRFLAGYWRRQPGQAEG